MIYDQGLSNNKETPTKIPALGWIGPINAQRTHGPHGLTDSTGP